VDAELIARMIAHEHTKLHAWIPPTPQHREIDRLIKRRAKLISLREAVAMSLHELGGFATELKALRTRFNQLIARIDLRVKALVEASPDRKQNFTRLCTISGVGPVVGSALVNTLERVPVKSADAFVAFTGLDPRPDDSGQHRGKRRLSKRGPAELRRLLYLAALSAVKTKPWRPLYEHYRARGLSSTAALVIGASLAPPGRFTPTRQNSIPRVSRIPSYEPIDTNHRIYGETRVTGTGSKGDTCARVVTAVRRTEGDGCSSEPTQ
jgi:transposase